MQSNQSSVEKNLLPLLNVGGPSRLVTARYEWSFTYVQAHGQAGCCMQLVVGSRALRVGYEDDGQRRGGESQSYTRPPWAEA